MFKVVYLKQTELKISITAILLQFSIACNYNLLKKNLLTQCGINLSDINTKIPPSAKPIATGPNAYFP